MVPFHNYTPCCRTPAFFCLFEVPHVIRLHPRAPFSSPGIISSTATAAATTISSCPITTTARARFGCLVAFPTTAAIFIGFAVAFISPFSRECLDCSWGWNREGVSRNGDRSPPSFRWRVGSNGDAGCILQLSREEPWLENLGRRDVF